METIQAKWYYPGRQRNVRLIGIHCTVSPEMGTGAEDVARYFQRLPSSNKASAHKVVDNNSAVTCVADEDTAFAAAGANADGLHLELIGQPTQTREEWLDDYSSNEFVIAREIIDGWCKKYDIPKRLMTLQEVADGVSKGITDHATISKAFPKVSTGHWDPGPNFPFDVFLDGDEPLTDDDRKFIAEQIEHLRVEVCSRIDGHGDVLHDDTASKTGLYPLALRNLNNNEPRLARVESWLIKIGEKLGVSK